MCKSRPDDVNATTPDGAAWAAPEGLGGSKPVVDRGALQPRLRIALIGTDGLPARYGGFETCVAQLAPRLAALGHQVEVFGSSRGRSARAADGPGLRHRYLPLRANGAASVPYDLLSFLLSYRRSDAIVVMGVSAGVFMPLMRWLAGPRRIVVNVDGLEARRSKWRGLPRAFLRLSERLAIRHAHHVVSDNQGIADIVSRTYGRSSTVIPYGNDHVLHLEPTQVQGILQQFLVRTAGTCSPAGRLPPVPARPQRGRNQPLADRDAALRPSHPGVRLRLQPPHAGRARRVLCNRVRTCGALAPA